MYVRVGLTSQTKTPVFRGLLWVAHMWESSTIWNAQVSNLAFSCCYILVKKSYWWCVILTSPAWFFIWTPNCTWNDTDFSQQMSNKCTQRFLQGMPNWLLQCAHLLLSQLNDSPAFHHLNWHLQIHTKTISLTPAAKFHHSCHFFVMCCLSGMVCAPSVGWKCRPELKPCYLGLQTEGCTPKCAPTPVLPGSLMVLSCSADLGHFLSFSAVISEESRHRSLLWLQLMWLNQLKGGELKYLLLASCLTVSWVVSWRATEVSRLT